MIFIVQEGYYKEEFEYYDKMHLNLEKVHKLAEKVGGKSHNFRYV